MVFMHFTLDEFGSGTDINGSHEHRMNSQKTSMSIRTPLTEYAKLATHELFQLTFVCKQIAGDIIYDESVLQERNKKWPDLSPVTNQPFNSAASSFLGIFQLCRGVDIYNWYCREALSLALSSNPKPIIDIIRKKTGKIAQTIGKADKKQWDAAAEVVREFLQDRYKGDRIVRQAIHRDLDVMQNPEVELLCTCRNILVHPVQRVCAGSARGGEAGRGAGTVD
jgi:hypothetical protein